MQVASHLARLSHIWEHCIEMRALKSKGKPFPELIPADSTIPSPPASPHPAAPNHFDFTMGAIPSKGPEATSADLRGGWGLCPVTETLDTVKLVDFSNPLLRWLKFSWAQCHFKDRSSWRKAWCDQWKAGDAQPAREAWAGALAGSPSRLHVSLKWQDSAFLP